MTPKFPVVTFRAKLAEEGFDGYVCPRFDEHQGEYHVPYDYRLAHISGFTGSAEVAIVMRVRAASSSTGAARCRYTMRSTGAYLPSSHDAPLKDWLRIYNPAGAAPPNGWSITASCPPTSAISS
ncbi:MAG: hypothetical protein VX601_00345 [Pseudomonadota bacterium]|nr:hypothetical protein [Pseudomonadota bacterium]